MGDELRQSFALLPGRSRPWVRVPEPSESSVKKFICGRSLPACPLSVEGPAENEFRRTIVFSCHSPQPTVDQRGLPDTSPSDNADDVHLLVRPRGIQESDIRLSPKNIASGNGQSRYRDFLRSQFCWRIASYGGRF